MASLPKAQFQLPSANRQIANAGDYYLFATSYAKMDMTPLTFDRQFKDAPMSYIPMYPFNLEGANGRSVVAVNAANYYQPMAGFASVSGLKSAGAVWTSTSGITAGRKFRTIGDNFYEVATNGELTRIIGLSSVGFYSTATSQTVAQGFEIFAESATRFYLIWRSTYFDTGTAGYNETISRTGLVIIIKSNWGIGWVGPAQYGSTATLNNVAASTGDGSVNNAVATNKSYKILATLSDGRILALYYASTGSGYATGTNQVNHRYVVINLSSDTAVTGNFVARNATWIVTIASDILLDPTNAVLGWYYWPNITAVDTLTIQSIPIPSTIASTPASPAAGTDCTINGLPNGVTLITPGTTIGSPTNSGQYTLLTLVDNGISYLLAYTHSNCQPQQESGGAPVSRHRLFIFQMDPTNPTVLTYVNHHDNAFGYGAPLTEFVTSRDNKTIVVHNGTSFGILTWNSAAKKFNVSPLRDIPSKINRLSLDVNSQIWVEDVNAKVYVFNLDLSASVDISFDGNPQSLSYTGTTFTQVANVNVYSFTGDRIARTVRLVAKGATFADGSTTKQVVSLTTGAYQESLYVNGSGNLSLEGYLV